MWLRRSFWVRFFFLIAIFCSLSLMGQEKNEGDGKKKPPVDSKELRKKEKKKWKEERKRSKAEKKAIKKHHKRIQTKKTNKRMKKNKRKAQRNNDHKGEFFLKRWFSKKKKT
mgnify:CR=1 FL=1